MGKLLSNSITAFVFVIAIIGLSQPFQIQVALAAEPTLIFSEDFETGVLPNSQGGKWKECPSANSISTAVVHAGTYSLLYDPESGNTNPGCTASIQDTQNIYMRMWWYLPVGFDSVQGPGHHSFRITYREGDQYFVNQFDTGIRANEFIKLDVFWGGDASYSLGQLLEGTWNKFELLLRLNDPGVSNGEIHSWVNGQKFANELNLDIRGLKTENINTFLATTNYDAPYSCDTCPHYWYLDDIELWTDCPPTGASCSGSGTSPLAPTGLTVK